MNIINYKRAKSIIAKALEIPIETIPDDANIENLEPWDSIGHVKIILLMEELCDKQLDPSLLSELYDIKSIAEICDKFVS